jgi:hypothetical protein
MSRFILMSILIAICSNVYSQSDTIKTVNYDKKIDFKTKAPIGLYFNRIEGYTPLLKGEIIFRHINDLSVKSNLNYSTHKNNFTYSISVSYPVLKDKITIGGSYFDNIFSNEHWTVSRLENTVAGIFINKDYMNYYSINGYSFSSQYYINKTISFGLRYIKFNYRDLGDSTGFAKSLFRSNNTYRINPSISEERQNAIEFNIRFNQLKDSPFFGKSGWHTNIIYKTEYGDIKNNLLNISSSLYILTRGLQKIYFSGNLIMNNGSYNHQYLYGLGGIRVMKAFDPYTDIGQDLAYLNIEYQFASHSLNKKSKAMPVLPIIFGEFGKIWDTTEPDDQISNVQHAKLLSDLGIGLIFNKRIRFNLAKQINNKGNWQFSVNLEFPTDYE